MDVSVIIPTHGRPGRVAACVGRLAQQRFAADRYEVLVGLDGPDPASARAAAEAWGDSPAALRVVAGPREGLNATRNRLLSLARGRYILSLNDDVLPAADLIRRHVEAHRQAETRHGQAIIVGYSPFVRPAGASVLDVLTAETSMVFFYDQMCVRPGGARSVQVDGRLSVSGASAAAEGGNVAGDASGDGAGGAGQDGASFAADDPSGVAPDGCVARRGAWHDWGFRHCFGLNFSVSLDAVRDVGGFVAIPLAYGYDDIELAWRLRERFRMPVLFRPGAFAPHDHRYRARDLLEREQRLGRAAWAFAAVNPHFTCEVFGRDIRSDEEVQYARQFMVRERPMVRRLEGSFLALESMPASALAGPHREALITMLYEHHLPLKRWYWRAGLLAAAGASVPAALW